MVENSGRVAKDEIDAAVAVVLAAAGCVPSVLPALAAVVMERRAVRGGWRTRVTPSIGNRAVRSALPKPADQPSERRECHGPGSARSEVQPGTRRIPLHGVERIAAQR